LRLLIHRRQEHRWYGGRFCGRLGSLLRCLRGATRLLGAIDRLSQRRHHKSGRLLVGIAQHQ
jgi:hypothetical protein